MLTHARIVVALGVGAILVAAAAPMPARAAGPVILKRQPQEGSIHPGERVLIDDGSCPEGQVREIVGGGNRSLSSTKDRVGSKRTERCIRTP